MGARHAQRPAAGLMTCSSCKDGRCSTCVDVDRAQVGLVAKSGTICTCSRVAHAATVAEATDGHV